ncbi:hypothetical protein CC2G_013616 [Coprinopsis cinerea AmutBmut pab1-1]|nr:hypothetical protein CC2G_013616 [Coprinopsis cinerea AmutBmut pab1-1]
MWAQGRQVAPTAILQSRTHSLFTDPLISIVAAAMAATKPPYPYTNVDVAEVSTSKIKSCQSSVHHVLPNCPEYLTYLNIRVIFTSQRVYGRIALQSRRLTAADAQGNLALRLIVKA